MRLVSPAPVMVPPNGSRAPPQAPQIYPPQQTQQSLYSAQNGSSVGGGMYHTRMLSLCVVQSSSVQSLERTNKAPPSATLPLMMWVPLDLDAKDNDIVISSVEGRHTHAQCGMAQEGFV